MLTWRRNTKFCSVCGSDDLEVARSGSGAKCSKCGHVSYPVTSPVGIVSVSDGSGDNLLLIRQPRYPPGMYSCIAGFLDAGESLEVSIVINIFINHFLVIYIGLHKVPDVFDKRQ